MRAGRRLAAAVVPFLLTVPSLFAALPAHPDGYVTDAAGVLSPPVERKLEALAAELEQKTGAQVAIVTVRTLDGAPVEDAAVRLFKDWGIGQKKANNGVLFLLSVDDRHARIEVGYGLEPLLPDARTGRILDEAIGSFRAGDYNRGVATVALRIMNAIADDRGVQLSGQPADEEMPPGQPVPGWVVLLFLVFALIVFIRHPWLFLLFFNGGRGGRWGGGSDGGGFGGFGGFGGGASGGGGASRGW